MANIKKILKSTRKLDAEQRQKQILELINEAGTSEIDVILQFIKEDDSELLDAAISKLSEFLDNQKDGIRKKVVKMIAEHNTSGAKEALIKAVDDTNGDIRNIALEKLGKYEDEDLFETYIKVLENDSWQENQAIAAQALGELGNVDAVIPLTKLLEKYGTGSAAAKALGQLKDKRAIQPLFDALDKNVTLNEQMYIAMSKIGAEDYIDKLIERIGKVRSIGEQNALILALATTKSPIVIPYIISLGTNTTIGSTYNLTIKCLGITQCIEAAVPIIKTATRLNPNYPNKWIYDGWVSKFVITAVEVLLWQPQPEILKLVIADMENGSAYDFYELYIKLVTDPSCVEMLSNLANHKKKRIRIAAQEALAKINS